MKFNNVEISQESVEKARQWFYDNQSACIEEAVSGKVRVNNLEEYIEQREFNKMEIMAGKWDRTFPLMQRAHFIQTGKSVSLF